MGDTENKRKRQSKGNKKFLKYGIILVLAILIVAGFVFFLVEGPSDLSSNVVATVNGEEITFEQVETTKQNLMQQGQQVSEKDALEQIINQELILQEVQKEGISVSTEEAESAIEQQIAMQGASLEDYKQQLSQQGISYEEQLESIKEELAVQEYLETQFEGENLNVSEEEARAFYEQYKQQGRINETYEEVKSQIIEVLQQQKQQEALSSLVQELRTNAEIEYLQEVESEVNQNPSQKMLAE